MFNKPLICTVCKRRKAILHLRASGEWICNRCLCRRIEKRVVRILKKKIKEKFIVLGFSNMGTVVLSHILARFPREDFSIYTPYDDALLKWIRRRYKLREAYSDISEVQDKVWLVVPFSLEELSAFFLKSIMKLHYSTIFASKQVVFPLSSFDNQQLEIYAVYRKLPIIPCSERDLYNKLFHEIEEKTPTIRYQFISFINSLKRLISD